MTKKTILAVALVTLALAPACKKEGESDDAKGPAERAGEKIDTGAEKAKESTGHAMDKAGRAVSDAGSNMTK